ncbi:MAG TPA: hypothetical protein VG184_07520 [Acidimicrobiales bacterium]|nr:hypothetical protein [Acidimicrobiales bacterium]
MAKLAVGSAGDASGADFSGPPGIDVGRFRDLSPAVVAMRDIHAAIDLAVFAAYGWDDLDPEIGHHPTKIGIRWTVSPPVRFEILDRLLAENHRRFAAEQAH